MVGGLDTPNILSNILVWHIWNSGEFHGFPLILAI